MVRSTSAFLVFSTCLAIAAAQAQQTQNTQPNLAQATALPAGIENAALAGSARASKLIGSRVYKGDASIGQIEDVLVDLDKATVRAIIISVGGFLGVGDRLVAVPVSQIKVGSEAKFMTELTKEQLASAPAFEFADLK